MRTTNKGKQQLQRTTRAKAGAFAAVLVALRAQYDQEIECLAVEYRPRILGGEFSGSTPPPADEPRYLRLIEDLEDHPWLATERGQRVVIACSRWLELQEKASTDPETGDVLGGSSLDDPREAAGCMAHDVLAVAAARGWVKPMRFINDECYTVRHLRRSHWAN